MTPQLLDFYFPFLVLFYGLIMVFVLSNPLLIHLAEERLEPNLWLRFKGHLFLGWVCVAVGLLWSLQNLVVSS